MSIKQNYELQPTFCKFIQCIDVLNFFPQYGYIIHGKHNSTDRSLYFINHQNPPFLFLDQPFIQNHPLYQWIDPVSHPVTHFFFFGIFKTHPFLSMGY